MKGKYLITTSAWFVAPDGKSYNAAWGEVTILEDSFLGIKTNRNSTNWYIKIGSEDKFAIIAGCQVNYAVKCDKKPYTSQVEGWDANAEHGCKIYLRPSGIYIAE